MDTTLIGITDLRTNAKQILTNLGRRPVTILSRSKPVGVLVHPDQWETLQDRLDELAAQVAILTREHDTVPLEIFEKELASARGER